MWPASSIPRYRMNASWGSPRPIIGTTCSGCSDVCTPSGHSSRISPTSEETYPRSRTREAQNCCESLGSRAGRAWKLPSRKTHRGCKEEGHYLTSPGGQQGNVRLGDEIEIKESGALRIAVRPYDRYAHALSPSTLTSSPARRDTM